MTWENLAADADALRQRLGFAKWAVLGHSFGGQVALEYALRYPETVSHLVLLDTGGDGRWVQKKAAELLAERGYSPKKVELVRRFFNGELTRWEFLPILMRIGDLYFHGPAPWLIIRDSIRGEWRTKIRPEALISAGRGLWKGWTVMDRLHEISLPTLAMAGREDFLFPPEHQEELAAAIPKAHLRIVESAGHNAHSEQPAEVIQAVTDFIASDTPTA